MTNSNANSATITMLALAAHQELAGYSSDNGLAVDTQFNRLVDALSAERSKYLNVYSAKYASLDRDELDSTFMLAVWNEVSRYRNDNKGPFLKLLRRSLDCRAKDMLRKTVKRAQKESSLNAILGSFNETHALGSCASAEDEFMEREVVDDYIRQVSADPKVGPRQVALIRYRIENGISAREAVNLAPGVFRNHQQLIRVERRVKKIG